MKSWIRRGELSLRKILASAADSTERTRLA